MTNGRSRLLEPPWSGRALLISGGAMAVGIILLAIGWLGVDDKPRINGQVGWLNVAVLGIAIAAAGQAGWLLYGRRRVGRLRREVLSGPVSGRPAGVTVDRAAATARFVTVPGSRRYHRPACLLVAGKHTTAVSAKRAQTLLACEVCQP